MKKCPIILAVLSALLTPFCTNRPSSASSVITIAIHRYPRPGLGDSLSIVLPDSSLLIVIDGNTHFSSAEGSKEPTQLNFQSTLRAGEVFYSYRVPPGRVQVLRWSDGSSVALDAGSLLQFTSRDSTGHRHYYLEGRATVLTGSRREDAIQLELPFGIRVQTFHSAIYIDSYAERKWVMVGSYEGTALVIKDRHPLTVSKSKGVRMQSGDNYELLPDFWAPGEKKWEQLYSFSRLSAPEIAADLSRWYNRQVTLGRVDTNQVYAGTLSREISLDSACSFLLRALMLDLKPGISFSR